MEPEFTKRQIEPSNGTDESGNKAVLNIVSPPDRQAGSNQTIRPGENFSPNSVPECDNEIEVFADVSGTFADNGDQRATARQNTDADSSFASGITVIQATKDVDENITKHDLSSLYFSPRPDIDLQNLAEERETLLTEVNETHQSIRDSLEFMNEVQLNASRDLESSRLMHETNPNLNTTSESSILNNIEIIDLSPLGLIAAQTIPQNFEEARASKHWPEIRAAMQKLRDIIANETWTLVPYDTNVKPVGSR